MKTEPLLRWTKKDLIGIRELSRSEIEIILDLTPKFLSVSERASGIKKVPLLQGRLVVNWFHEPSTRTRTSFELAAKRLSADILSITASSLSTVKGETLHDTLANIEAMNTDILVLRHSGAGVPHILAKDHASHIINAGDGRHEHPTQALLDAFTMREEMRRLYNDPNRGLDGIKVALVGDIQHSRVARSNIHALTKLGADVTVCGPATLLPRGIEGFGVKVTTDLGEALENVDVIYALRIQMERQGKALFPSVGEYVRLFRIDRDALCYAPDHAIVMHPGPINRDLELSTEVADGPRSVILKQVTNGVAVRMAVMHVLANAGSSKEL
ncbi:MAG: aspartate carbamoyltransferase catalytic subunit [Candidatus Hydrogenedentes bacterium]|jgi:aspartate carbamoyltransferase catalytic subunit|nr:aspartate carbamoyltransferase catalytic subunit [Candidatus Hydrogenedentota bacterium]